jgi:hypothetical protein
MSTRGIIYFELQDSPDATPEKVGQLNIMSDAYPSYIGNEIYKQLKNVVVAGSDPSDHPNIERVILDILYDITSDYLQDDEYVYRFIFKTYLIGAPPCRVADITEVTVKCKWDEDTFIGSLREFREYCEKRR